MADDRLRTATLELHEVRHQLIRLIALRLSGRLDPVGRSRYQDLLAREAELRALVVGEPAPGPRDAASM